jgi:4-azaleucine resistance transporter AzlC
MTRQGIWEGMRGIAAIAAAVLPFGIAYGVAATAAGMTAAVALAMSMAVYAGGAQFAVLELWPPGAHSIASIVTATVAVNARLLIYGATLAPLLTSSRGPARYVGAFLLSDESWALASRRLADGKRGLGILIGAGATLWCAWVLGTLLGVQVGSLSIDLDRLGLDVLMAAFFVAILMSTWQGRSDLLPWLVAALTAWGGTIVLPAGYSIALAALACGVAGEVTSAKARA